MVSTNTVATCNYCLVYSFPCRLCLLYEVAVFYVATVRRDDESSDTFKALSCCSNIFSQLHMALVTCIYFYTCSMEFSQIKQRPATSANLVLQPQLCHEKVAFLMQVFLAQKLNLAAFSFWEPQCNFPSNPCTIFWSKMKWLIAENVKLPLLTVLV